MPRFDIVVAVNPAQAVAGSRVVNRSLDTIQARATRLRAFLVRAFALTALIAGITSLIRAMAQFEQAMSTVRAISQATAFEFSLLREEASRLGATTRFTSTQAAEGMIFLARAGFTVAEILESIEGTLRLAQAGAIDLASAADIASNVLQGFRLETSETARVIDVLARTANSSNTDIRQLGAALKFVAPVAAGLGVDIEETSAAVGALSNAGLQASLAGTGLRRVLTGLVSPTAAFLRALQSVGVDAAEVDPQLVGLAGAVERLGEAGFTTAQAIESFGQRGGPAFEVLVSSLDDLRRLDDLLRNAAGTAEEVARVMDDNLQGALFRMQSAAEAVVRAFGELGATSFLTTAFQNIAAVLRAVARNLETVADVAGLFLTTLAVPRLIAITRAIAGVAAGVGGLTIALGLATTAARFLGRALLIGFAVEAISRTHRLLQEMPAVVGAIRSGWEQVRAVVVRITEEVVGFYGGIVGVAGGLVLGVQRNFDELPRYFQGLGVILIRIWGQIFDQINGLTRGAAAFIGVTLRNIWPVVRDLGFQILSFIAGLVDRTAQLFVELIRNVQSGGTSPQFALTLRATAEFINGVLGGAGEDGGQAFADAYQRGVTERLGEQFADRAIAIFGLDESLAPQIASDLYEAFVEGRREAIARLRSLFAGAPPSGTAFAGIIAPALQREFEDPGSSVFAAADAFGERLDAAFTGDGSRFQLLPNLDFSIDLPEYRDPNAARDALLRGNRVALIQRELAALEEEARLLQAVGVERQVVEQQLRIEQQLRTRLREINEDLSLSELERLSALTEAEVNEIRILVDRNDLLTRQAQIEDSLNGPARERIRNLQALDALYQQGRISLDQYNQALADFEFHALQTATNARAGFQRALLGISSAFFDAAASWEEAVVSSVRAMEDAFADFVVNGMADFSRLIDSILSDLARVAFRQALAPLFSSFANFLAPGGGSADVGLGGTRLASGGLVSGPGTSTSDSIHARLSAGEFVVNAAATRRNLGLLRSINAQRFQDGGLVGGGTGRGGGAFIRQVNYIDQRTTRADDPPNDVNLRLRGETLDIMVRSKVGDAIARGEFDGPMRSRYGQQQRLRS